MSAALLPRIPPREVLSEDMIQTDMACVVSKLLYSLDCECLRAADRRRLDAFHCRSLRVICNIPHSMLSHVSNVEVLATANVSPLTSILDRRQLILFGHIVALPDTSKLRESLLIPGTMELQQLHNGRKRGRPRLNWATLQHARATEALENAQLSMDNFFFDRSTAKARWCTFLS